MTTIYFVWPMHSLVIIHHPIVAQECIPERERKGEYVDLRPMNRIGHLPISIVHLHYYYYYYHVYSKNPTHDEPIKKIRDRMMPAILREYTHTLDGSELSPFLSSLVVCPTRLTPFWLLYPPSCALCSARSCRSLTCRVVKNQRTCVCVRVLQ